MLKQQISIAPVTSLFNLKSQIQLNNVGSEFESNNGIYTCIHPVTNSISSDLSVATFNIQIDKEDGDVVKERNPHLIKSSLLKGKPFYIKYLFRGWEQRMTVTLTVCITDKVSAFNHDEIPFVFDRLFGQGETYLVAVKPLETRDNSKDILNSYIQDLKFSPVQLVSNYEVFVADMQTTPFLKRAYVTKDKGTVCIFKEHLVNHLPVYNVNEYGGTRFQLKGVVDKILQENTEFDSIILEAYNTIESEEESYVIFTFCVNINVINKAAVIKLISALLNNFGVYKFNRVVPKKLTYLDVI